MVGFDEAPVVGLDGDAPVETSFGLGAGPAVGAVVGVDVDSSNTAECREPSNSIASMSNSGEM